MTSKLPQNAIDLEGERYGKLTVVSFSHADKGCYWNTRCDCGAELVVFSNRLRTGHVKSCGCLRKESSAAKAAKDDFASLWRRVSASIKRNAAVRDIPVNMTDEELIEVSKKDCYYCKAGAGNMYKSGRKKQYHILYSGIDRVDNTLGYEVGNVVPCCKLCNYAKRDMTVREFLIWVHQVARFTKEPEFDLSDLTERDISRHPAIQDVIDLYAQT